MGYMCYLRLLVQNNSIKINLRFSRADLKWESSLRCCFASIYTITWCTRPFLGPWVFSRQVFLLEWQLRMVNRSNDGSIVSMQLKSYQTILEISVYMLLQTMISFNLTIKQMPRGIGMPKFCDRSVQNVFRFHPNLSTRMTRFLLAKKFTSLN